MASDVIVVVCAIRHVVALQRETTATLKLRCKISGLCAILLPATALAIIYQLGRLGLLRWPKSASQKVIQIRFLAR